MQILKHKTNIDFIGKRKPALFISSVLNLAILVGIAIFGFNFGVDFAGGTVVELKFDHPIRADEVRARAEAARLHDVSVQGIGSSSDNGFLLRLGGVTQLTPESALTAKQALESLGKIDGRKSRVVELRYFGGMSIEETAEVLGISPETAKRDWRMARAWLFNALT